ncbi:unnamed protein product [Paramecium pentaurelia]|uniref:Transmembrane protein n=1 Tax=Paramecium pentaurelia TaxID=43138 RepID=A0A8S1V722_9CILI|nr:unnamed protein product [Paramecium pentaurelia]
MWFIFLIALGVGLNCPQVFYLSNIQEQANIITYQSDYNYIMASVQNAIVFIQAESGTLRQLKPIDGQSVTFLQTQQGYLFVGKTNQLQIYSLDEDNPIQGQLSFLGNINYLQYVNDVISISTDQSEALIWNMAQNNILGRTKSQSLQNILINYQVQIDQYADNILIGITSAGTYQLEYYSLYMQQFLNSFILTQFDLSQMISIQQDQDNINTYLYAVSSTTLTIYKINNNAQTITITNQIINIGIIPITMYLIQDEIIFLSANCQFQKYNIKQNSLGIVTQWIQVSQCPNNIKQLLLNYDDLIIIILINNPIDGSEMIQLYQVDQNLIGTKIRSFYYSTQSISASYILKSQYVLQVGQTNSNIQIFNQWFQLQQIIIINNNNYPALQIIQSDIILILYSNGLVITLSETSFTCQFTQYQCYTYNLQDSFQQQNVATYTNQMIQQFQYNNIIYVAYALNQIVSFYSFTNNIFSTTITNQQDLLNNILQIVITDNSIQFLLSNNYINSYPFSIAIQQENNPISINLQLQNVIQITQDHTYQVITNGQAIQISLLSDPSNSAVLQQPGRSYKQILIYNDYLLVLEQQSYTLSFYQLTNLIQQIDQTDYVIKTQYFSQYFILNNNYLIVQFKYYIMTLQLNEYFQTGQSGLECVFTQTYSSNSNVLSFINTQISLTNFYILYQTLDNLLTVRGTININKQNIDWDRIIINQGINQDVKLYFIGISTSQSSIIIRKSIEKFNSVNFQDLTLIVPFCKLQLSNIVISNIVNCQIINSQSQQCPYFIMDNVYQFMLQNFKINNFEMSQPFIQSNLGANIQLNNIEISNSKLYQLVQITDKTLLLLKTITISNSQCSSSATSINQLFQYYQLDVQDLTINGNQLCSTLFNNILIESLQPIIIKFNNIVIQDNSFSTYLNAAILNQQLSNLFYQSAITLNTIQLFNNQYQQVINYAFKFSFGKSIDASHLIFDNSSFLVQSFDTITLNDFTFSVSSSLSLAIFEIPHIIINQVYFDQGTIYQNGLITISNQNDYDCTQINSCLIQISLVNILNFKIISASLLSTCYGILIDLKSKFQVSLSQISITNLQLKQTDYNFIVSSTGIYFQGYQSQLQIDQSDFNNINCSTSTSLLVLNAQMITFSFSNVNYFNATDSTYHGVQNIIGGVAQISCTIFQVQNSNFNQIYSFSGSIFLIQMYHSSSYNPKITFTNNNINNVFSFGNGAIYIDNTLENTIITIQANKINSIFSLQEGGFLFFQKEETTNYPYLNITNVDISNISNVQPYKFTKQLNFLDNSFSNIYSKNGSILKIELFNITIKNNTFSYNNLTQTPLIFNPYQLTQGSLFYLEHCVFSAIQLNIKNIQSFSTQAQEGQLIYTNQTWISIQNSNFFNIITKNSQLLQLITSYLNINALTIQNISQIAYKLNQSLIQLQDCTIYMLNLQLKQLSCDLSNCLTSGFYLKNTYSYIKGGSCQGNKGNFGSCFYLTLKEQFVQFENVSMINNYAQFDGGSILADLQNVSNMKLVNCTFSSNVVLGSGGGLYINSFNKQFQLSEVLDIPVITIIQCYFVNNIAYRYGGGIKTQVFSPFLIDVFYYNNSALVEGSDISSYPSSLFLSGPLINQGVIPQVYDEDLQPADGYFFIKDINDNEYIISNFKSGDTMNSPLQLVLKSSNNLTMYNEESYLKIFQTNNQNYSLSISNSDSQVKFNQTGFFLDGLTLIGIPSTEFTYYLTSDEIKSTNQYNYYYTNNYNYTLKVIFRKCLYGEIKQSFDSQTICYKCPQGFYSFSIPTDEDPGQCQVCPLISTYHIQCYGGAETNLESNYWRENVTTLEIYKCDPQFSNCLGGVSQSQCGIGYMGRMCQSCDYNDNYARDTRSSCVVCTQVEWPLVIILLTSIGVLIYFTMSIFFLAQDVVILCVLPCLNQLLPPLKKIGSNLGQVKDLNSLMKIFLAYYQKTSLVTKIVVNIPSQLQDSQDPSIFDFSLECPMINVNNYIPMVYVNYIIEVLKPISSMLFFMFIWTILFRNQKIKRGIYYTATWLVIWLFYLPSFYEKTLQLLNCKDIGNNRYLKPDLNQDCYGTQHFFYTLFISIPCLFFFVIYIPCMLLYHIRNDMRKKDKRPLRKYKYYYINGEFREKYYYWEFVRLLEKILIQTAIEIFFYDNIYMAESCLIIVLIYGIASFVTQPYGYKRQNFINVISSFTAFGTIYIALVIASLKNQFTDPNEPIIIFFEVILAAINAVYALWMSWKLFIVLMPVLFVNIEQIQRKLSNIKYLRKFFLGERLRAKLLFKQIGQKVIVINLIKKHAMMRYLKKEQKEKQLIEIEEKIRNRKQTAAQEALNYILRNNLQSEIIQLKDNNNVDQQYVELQDNSKL